MATVSNIATVLLADESQLEKPRNLVLLLPPLKNFNGPIIDDPSREVGTEHRPHAGLDPILHCIGDVKQLCNPHSDNWVISNYSYLPYSLQIGRNGGSHYRAWMIRWNSSSVMTSMNCAAIRRCNSGAIARPKLARWCHAAPQVGMQMARTEWCVIASVFPVMHSPHQTA